MGLGARQLRARGAAVAAAVAVACTAVLAAATSASAATQELTVAKTVDGEETVTVHAGDTVTYRVVVSNPSGAPVTLTSFTDVARSEDADAESVPDSCAALVDETIGAGGSVSCSYTGAPAADTVNTATVAGRDRSGRTVGPVADAAAVDVINPAITIDKTANPAFVVGVSGTTTFTYLVTNTGDVALTDIVVTDEVLGEIGRIASLAPGESAELTRDATVTVAVDSHPTAAIAVGRDPLGGPVTDDDHASVDFILGEVYERPLPPPAAPAVPTTPAVPQVVVPPPRQDRPATLARTGPETGPLAVVGGAFVGLGLLLVAPGRRRRRRAG